MADITLTFEFSPAEFQRAHLLIFQSSPQAWFGRLAGLASALWGSYLTAGGWRHGALAAVLTGLPWLLLGLFWANIGRLTARRQTKTIIRKMPAFSGTQTRSFSREGMFFASPEVAQHLSWTAIQRVQETEEFLLFYVGPSAAHYLPKHAIPVALEEPLRELLGEAFAGRAGQLRLRPWAT